MGDFQTKYRMDAMGLQASSSATDSNSITGSPVAIPPACATPYCPGLDPARSKIALLPSPIGHLQTALKKKEGARLDPHSHRM